MYREVIPKPSKALNNSALKRLSCQSTGVYSVRPKSSHCPIILAIPRLSDLMFADLLIETIQSPAELTLRGPFAGPTFHVSVATGSTAPTHSIAYSGAFFDPILRSYIPDSEPSSWTSTISPSSLATICLAQSSTVLNAQCLLMHNIILVSMRVSPLGLLDLSKSKPLFTLVF